jgi:hypothetical protein
MSTSTTGGRSVTVRALEAQANRLELSTEQQRLGHDKAQATAFYRGTRSTAVNTSAAQVILTNLSISTGQTVNLVSMTMSFAGTITA